MVSVKSTLTNKIMDIEFNLRRLLLLESGRLLYAPFKTTIGKRKLRHFGRNLLSLL